MLPLYEEELAQFKQRVGNLGQEQVEPLSPPGPKLIASSFELLSDHAETYELTIDAKPCTDRGYVVMQLAEELEGLTGIRFSHTAVKLHVFTYDAGEITFDPRSPGRLLILGIVPADAEIAPRDAGLSPGRM